jgi:hypothetical protein
MKKDRSKPPARPRPSRDDDDIRPEYDFSAGQPNKYASAYAEGTNVVLLDPDVAAVFPTAIEVNEALRALAGIIAKHRPGKDRSRSSA